MSDPAPGQEPTPPTGQEPSEPPAPPQPPVGQEPRADEKFDAEYVAKLRAEAAETRRKLREAEARNAEHERQKLSETERLQLEAREAKAAADAALAELRQERERVAVLEAASAAGIDPKALPRVQRLVDVPRDAAGEIDHAGLKRAIDALLTDLPGLRAATVSTSVANGARGGAVADAETDEQRRRRLAGGVGLSAFDPAVVRAGGGGVVFDPEHSPKQRDTRGQFPGSS